MNNSTDHPISTAQVDRDINKKSLTYLVNNVVNRIYFSNLK